MRLRPDGGFYTLRNVDMRGNSIEIDVVAQFVICYVLKVLRVIAEPDAILVLRKFLLFRDLPVQWDFLPKST